MREYAGGFGTVRKCRGKWQGIVRYRECDTGETDSEGKPVKGPWKMTAKLFDVKSYPNNNRGQKTAQDLLRKWRAELEEQEPERAKREQERRKAEERGEALLTPDTTVSDYVTYYIEELLPNNKRMEESTLESYRICLRRIEDKLGSIKLRDLTRSNIEQWRDGMNRKYAPATTKNTLRLLKAALEEARKRGLIEEDPSRDVSAPQPRNASIAYLDDAARLKLLDDLDKTLAGEMDSELRSQSDAHALGIKLALLTGMRRGEICALQWADVDLDGGTITVRHAIGEAGGSAGQYLKGPKSGAGVRVIPVTDAGLIDDLRARRSRMRAAAKAAGVKLPKSAYVIGTPDGAPTTPNYFYHAFKRRCTRLGITNTNGESPRIHDLRHTFATVMAHSGVPATNLKQIMGHSSIDTTYRYYIGVDDDANRRAMELTMQRMYGGDIASTEAEG